MVDRAWRWAVVAGVLVGAGYLLLDSALLRESLWILTVAAACSAMALGARLHRPDHPRPLYILAAAFGLILVSYLVDFPAWASPTTHLVHGLIQLVAYPLIPVAVLALVRLQAPGGDREGAIDGAIVMIAMATLLAGTVFESAWLAAEDDLPSRVLAIVAPLVLSAVMAATMRVLFVGSVRVVSAWLLVAAATTSVTGAVTRTVMMTHETYLRGSWIDLFLLASYALVAVACLHPSMVVLTRPREPGSRRLTFARLLVLGASLLAAPATLVVQEPGIGVSLPIISSVVLSLLVLWRLARLVIEREAVRQALHERAARQEALAQIGRRALADPELDGLSQEVTRCCRELLGLDSCSIVGPDEPLPEAGVTVDVHPTAGTLVAVRQAPWSDEDLAFLHSAANVLTGAYRRHEDQETMRYRAVHDALTGLPNRVLIVDRLEQALARSRRSGATVAVLFLDLDGFKQINDVYGHQAGDDVLVSVAARLQAQVRAEDTVGRLSGDEFVVVCDQADQATAGAIADRIVTALEQPLDIEAGSVRVGVSIGLTASTGATPDAERLLAEADLAMYEAKQQLGNAVVPFDHSVGESRERQRALEIDLGVAVAAEEQLRLVYQPLVAVDPDGREQMAGVEALLRWDHPVHGPIPPLEFIPLAEATGLILPLGDWVIRRAVEQAAAWTAGLPDDVPFTIWINLSGRQLADPDLPARVARILAEAGVPPWRFGCEVTESVILGETTAPVAAALQRVGIQIALDDFGTGFASLSHLRGLAMNLVKIDRSFISGVTEVGGDRAIVRAVTALAHELGVDVVAEGVETAAQRAVLCDLGCDLVQGYLLGRPVPPEEIALPFPATDAGSATPAPVPTH